MTPENGVDTIAISPSRFSVLEVVENSEIEESEKEEEGEIKEVKNVLNTNELAEEKSTRPSLPRHSKLSHKFVSDSRSQITKEKPPSALSRRGLKKKH